jgi:hypothetical protein
MLSSALKTSSSPRKPGSLLDGIDGEKSSFESFFFRSALICVNQRQNVFAFLRASAPRG